MLLKVLLTLASPLALITIAELARLVRTGRRAGGHNGAVKAGLGDNVNLDSRVTLEMLATKLDKHKCLQTYPRVVDGAGVDLGDGHGEGLLLRESIGELGSRKV